MNKFGKNNENYKDGRTLKKYYCTCGKRISITSGVYGSGLCRSCSKKLQFKDITNHGMFGRKRPEIKGKNNPNYIHGMSKFPYPLEFNCELKEKIRLRDNYECTCCGMSEEEHLIVIGKVLNIHHIDYNKMNCKESNLITTCSWCNLRANTNRKYWLEFYNSKINEQTKERK